MVYSADRNSAADDAAGTSTQVFEAQKRRLESDGYLYLEDLPEDFDHLAFAQRFGTLMPQYDGEIVWSIKADPKFDDHYHSLNTKKLNPHTECYEFEGTPPRYLALWCVHPASCGGGLTTLADGYRFIEQLSDSDRRYVSEKRFPYCSSSGIQASNLGRVAEHPMYDTSSQDRPIVRYSFNCMQRDGDARMEEIAQRFKQFFHDTCVGIEWKKNAFLIWDNFRILHSRTAYKDRARELRRVWLS